MKLINNPY